MTYKTVRLLKTYAESTDEPVYIKQYIHKLTKPNLPLYKNGMTHQKHLHHSKQPHRNI